MVKIYRFQRLMIAAAVIIWAVFAGRLVYKGIKGETMDVVDTFCENVYYDISADISATGKLDNGDVGYSKETYDDTDGKDSGA